MVLRISMKSASNMHIIKGICKTIIIKSQLAEHQKSTTSWQCLISVLSVPLPWRGLDFIDKKGKTRGSTVCSNKTRLAVPQGPISQEATEPGRMLESECKRVYIEPHYFNQPQVQLTGGGKCVCVYPNTLITTELNVDRLFLYHNSLNNIKTICAAFTMHRK